MDADCLVVPWLFTKSDVYALHTMCNVVFRRTNLRTCSGIARIFEHLLVGKTNTRRRCLFPEMVLFGTNAQCSMQYKPPLEGSGD